MGLKRSTILVVLVFILVFGSVGTCSGEGPLPTERLTIWSINPNTPFGDLTDRFARQFSAENAGFILKSVHFPNDYYKTALPPEMKEEFDFFSFPSVEGGQGNSYDLVGSPGQDYLAVSASCRHPDVAVKFLSEYVCSESYFRELANLGFVPPVQNAEAYLSDPVSRKVARAFQAAGHVQIYYDVVMTQTMAEIHKLLVHQLFELRLSPEQVARNHRDVIFSELDRR